MANPAASPRRKKAAAAMAARAAAWRRAPRSQTYFRIGRLRTTPAMTSWGRRDPDSRMGTRNPIQKAGAPRPLRSQGSTVLALASSSASFVRVWLAVILKKFPGTSVQAPSGISLQTRASSSSTNKE